MMKKLNPQGCTILVLTPEEYDSLMSTLDLALERAGWFGKHPYMSNDQLSGDIIAYIKTVKKGIMTAKNLKRFFI